MGVEPLDPASSPALAAALLRLQRASYAVEAVLIGDDRIPPLHEDQDALVAADLRWWGERDDGRIVGAIGVRDDGGGEADLDRLVVDPAWFRRGIGGRLVRHLQAQHRRVVVSTGRSNAPARLLYGRAGFAHRGDREVLPGLWVSDYAWTRTGD
ncbi:ribosomal protein S18 acetylase RimI-like enzyme [Nocardioides zeae]|uniref:Ribosomal protein S18 acetylase RimI-like enzyme n=1 Tax=Nocardioides zeae TaxID=1457234 RepID=A0ACC6ICM9_9ACTN|nr:GNAT family N-acetyltransferase [Nocardioides zeae]MDR6175508.1 ribosomal protein S18 acetylase RimI-like enzyme [Nocardioides zeae]MDR6208439.1 ribosomal protein S18 acetylase RimI-like enzyme [Nocardioides zeae]